MNSIGAWLNRIGATLLQRGGSVGGVAVCGGRPCFMIGCGGLMDCVARCDLLLVTINVRGMMLCLARLGRVQLGGSMRAAEISLVMGTRLLREMVFGSPVTGLLDDDSFVLRFGYEAVGRIIASEIEFGHQGLAEICLGHAFRLPLQTLYEVSNLRNLFRTGLPLGFW